MLLFVKMSSDQLQNVLLRGKTGHIIAMNFGAQAILSSKQESVVNPS